MIGYWGQTLARATGWNVVVRPHPKTRPERLDSLRRHGVTITYEDTAVLVPLCDVYVAAVSATIRWAIACSKPVINYDVYQYGYRDYEGVQGVQLVKTRSEFAALLDRITSESAYRTALAACQTRDASRWGMLDGASGRRMADVFRGGPIRRPGSTSEAGRFAAVIACRRSRSPIQEQVSSECEVDHGRTWAARSASRVGRRPHDNVSHRAFVVRQIAAGPDRC